jgi:hypothetical protein
MKTRMHVCYWCGERGHNGGCRVYQQMMDLFTKEQIEQLYALKGDLAGVLATRLRHGPSV